MSDQSLDLDAPFKSFQKRFGAGELRTPDLNDSNRRLFGLPSQLVQREAFLAVPVRGMSEAEWAVERQQRRLQG